MSDDRDPGRRREEAPRVDADAARGGEIILRTRRRRAIFLGGFAAFVLFVVIAGAVLAG
ncbi:MAG: hypothetical protein ACOCYR_00535 [Erythrobacter sp.]